MGAIMSMRLSWLSNMYRSSAMATTLVLPYLVMQEIIRRLICGSKTAPTIWICPHVKSQPKIVALGQTADVN